ncbi:HNH endonuclease [Protaetiibacter mangrovi]|uniref:HNH endonuclease n=1 Tax=Protaetiibacter mangrovi TaxID=2970926 RepID=A0ABT1ZIE3_9MICO|nr:HNH endonuclease [Protaetiibacter mangrovi]MCS0500457.1 HNH endonuclease [Protaetiibacter mangrovi]TPW94281.1 HNH endonuclease [Schumannella luteola]
MAADSAKAKIRAHFRAHQGEVVKGKELAALVQPVGEWARRVRELRDEEGWPIQTQNDRQDLKPGEYMLVGEPPEKSNEAFKRGISQKLRAEVLDRDGFTCQMCGKAAGELDPDTSRPVRLHIGHIVDKVYGGKDELANLRTLCSTCNQGAKNITTEKPSTIWLLAQVRRAGNGEQQAVYEWLASKYGPKAD